MSKKFNIVVVGATGNVGREIIQILEQRNFPIDNLYLLASTRSKGKKIEFYGEELIVQDLSEFDFSKAQIGSLFSATLASVSGVLDYDTFNNFIVTLASGGNTLAAVTTEASQVGHSGVIVFIQPSSSSAATLSLHGDYETAGAAGVTLSSANNAYDILPYFIKADNSILLGAPQLAFG